MKLVVIGGVTGGASTAARVRRLDPNAEIVVFERGRDVSFSNCALPYRLSGVVDKTEKLIIMDPEDFKLRHNIDVKTRHEVTAIDRGAKEVEVLDLRTGGISRVKYDKLMLAPGARPILPKNIKGVGLPHVFTVRNVEDIERLKAWIDAAGVKDTAVIGSGFIGAEVAENIAMAGKHVSMIARSAQILKMFDEDMIQILNKELMDNGVDLYHKVAVKEITEDSVIGDAADGTRVLIPAQAVIMAAGIEPETELAKAAGLEIGETGAIKVDQYFRSSDPDIYAVGDAVEIFGALTGKPGKLSLAGPAQRQARQAANHMCGVEDSGKGYIGSSCLKVFGMNAAATGLNESAAKKAGYDCESVLLFPNDHVGVLPGSNYVAFKLVFEVPTGKILGAQAISRGEAVKRADVIAAMITMGATLEDLKELELCYSPVYSTAKDVVNMAALVGLNVMKGAFRQVHVSEARRLVESGAYIVDVREPGEYAAGHLNGAVNVPLSQIWQRMDEIPKDRPVYLHCRSGQRSYYAVRYLTGKGYTDVFNMSGGFLGISWYEYFRDVTEDRTPILDNYNFK